MKIWLDDTESCMVFVPNQKDNRTVIIHCRGHSGFVDGTLLVIYQKLENAPVDYHGSMNSKIFEEWFENCVLRLEEPSVIVCNNASYHNCMLNPLPNSSWKKQLILEFMRSHGIPVSMPVPVIPILLQIISEKLPMSERKKYAVDQIAASYGHVVFRLLPYHCIFNPIEMVWSEIKRKLASQNLKGRTLMK